MSDFTIQLPGEPVPGGCYLLMIRLTAAKKVNFGRYNQGDAVSLPVGSYIYAGSARAERGSSSLGARLIRHATRCDPAKPHAIRDLLLTSLVDAGIPAKVPASTHLFYLQNEAGWQMKVGALVEGLLNPDDGLVNI